MSQLVRNLVLFNSQICRVPKCQKINCEGFTHSRRARDTHDGFATILRGILSHKTFEQNFREPFAPFATHARKGGCFNAALRLTRDGMSPAVAKQPHCFRGHVVSIVRTSNSSIALNR